MRLSPIARSALAATSEVMCAVPMMPSIWSFWRREGVDLLVACLLGVGVGYGLEQLYRAIGLVDRLLHRLFAQRGVGVDQ